MRVNEAEAYASKAGAEVDGRNLSRIVSGAETRTATGGETKPEAAQGLLESCAGTQQHAVCLPAGGGKQRSAGSRWAHGSGVETLACGALAENQAVSVGGRIHASGSAQGGDTEAARRGTHPGHSLCAGSADPTGTSSDTATSVRSRVSESSYGFRPGRNAHQAVNAARGYVAEGRRWTVDLDLEKFFDRVNHDVLMARVGRKVKDPGVLKLIRRYLEAGLMEGGVANARSEGSPQGSPLSPLLSNILLDDLDRELERRGHRFCRYADDCNIYVQSDRAGQRVRQSITAFLEQRLRLKVNAAKSAVARPWERKFLGYSMTWHRKPKLKIASQSRERLREKIRLALRRGRGQSMQQVIKGLNPVLRGWLAYFRLTEVKNVLEELDGWLRHKLRTLLWRQWKRVYTRARNLMKAGIDKVRAWKSATNGRGPWWNGGASHMNQAYPKNWFDRMGLVSLLDTQRRFQSVS